MDAIEQVSRICGALRDGTARHYVLCEGSRWDGFPTRAAAERWGREQLGGRAFETVPYVPGL